MSCQWASIGRGRWNEAKEHEVTLDGHDVVRVFSQRGRSNIINLENAHRAECPKKTNYYD
jgi:hypothetical protein